MKILQIALITLFASLILLNWTALSYAHSIDDACQPGERAIEDGCVQQVEYFGFNVPVFFDVWHEFAHCRREFVGTDMVGYQDIISKILVLKAILGDNSFVFIRTDILEYYHHIPLLSIVRAPGDMLQACAELKACTDGRIEIQNNIKLATVELTRLQNDAAHKVWLLNDILTNYTLRKRRRR